MHERKLRKGPWLEEEDVSLATAVSILGERLWDGLAKASGLRRSGKSCRMRWMNYLRPNLKHTQISAEEEGVIIELHAKWGNKWSRIAQRLPGRTDNEIKNYWRSYMKRKARAEGKESLSITISSSGNDTLRSEFDKSTTSPCSVNGECFLFKSDDVQGFNSSDSDVLEMLNLMQSPFDTRLTASMSNLLSDTNKLEPKEESWNFDIPEWISYDYSASIWDFSLWDKD